MTDRPNPLHRPRLVEEAYLQAEADRLVELMQDDPSGRLLLVTATFPGRRFASSAWSSADPRRVMHLIERASDDLHHAFRGLFLATLSHAVEDFRRRDDLQPSVVAFLDDRQEGDPERYPHLHAVWFVPSAVAAPICDWIRSVEAARAWAGLSEGGSLHVEDVDPEPTSVRRVVAYAGKLLVAAQAAGIATGALCRTYPDRPAQDVAEPAQRPPQPRDGPSQAPSRRRRRRRRSADRRRAPSSPVVVRVRSRRAA